MGTGYLGARPVGGIDHGLVVAGQEHRAVVPSHAREHVELGEDTLLEHLRRRVAGEEHEEPAQPRRVLRGRHAPRAEREPASGRLPIEPAQALRHRRAKRIRVAVIEEGGPVEEPERQAPPL